MPRDIFLSCSPPETETQPPMDYPAVAGGAVSNTQTALDSEQTLQYFIENMMYTFGDVKKPLDVTVHMMEKILLDQMQTVYNLAAEYPKKRGQSEVEVLDVVFIYRKDVSMLHRIYRRVSACLQAMRLQQVAHARVPYKAEDKLTEELTEAFHFIGDQKLIDVLDESYSDSLRQERLSRMDRRTRHMDQEEYFEFHNARGISFASSASARKIFFHQLNKNAGWKLSTNACELLALIAYEIVAKLTEAAVAIRAIRKSGNEDDFQKSTIGRQYNPDFLANDPLFGAHFKAEIADPQLDHIQSDEPLQPHDVLEALYRLQECRKPVFCQGAKTKYLELI